MPSPSELSKLAQAILDLKYGDLADLSRTLRDMNVDFNYQLKSELGFAELLHTWAEAEVESKKEQK